MESEPELIFYQNWSESVRRSTWRELKAVCLALLAFASPSSNSKVFWYSDNQNVESILRDGSRKCDLKDLALVVFQICSHHCISFEVKWIPRDLNASAVCICKLVDFDGYGLNDFVLLRLNHLSFIWIRTLNHLARANTVLLVLVSFALIPMSSGFTPFFLKIENCFQS